MAFLRTSDPRKYSYPQIAKILHMRDHTSVLHGVRGAASEWGDLMFERLVRQPIPSGQGVCDYHSPTAAEIELIGLTNLMATRWIKSGVAA